MLAFEHLTSVKNPHVAQARELHSRKGREMLSAFLCEGEHMVLEALGTCPQAVESVFVLAEKQDRHATLLQAAFPGIGEKPLYAVNQRVMEALTQVKAPQGILAVVKQPPMAPIPSLGPRLVLLENVQDPGNVGTILRTLDAAGFDGCILLGGCADPFSPKTLRATMGSVFRVPMAFAGEAAKTFEGLRAAGYALLAAALSGEPFYGRTLLPQRLCLMIGNEGAGLTGEALAAATHCYRLPMAGGAESLNAAVAAAVMMYDLSYR